MPTKLALALALSVLGLLVGPALVAFGRGRALVTEALDGLILGAVPLLLLLHVAPHLYDELGILGVGLLAAGYVSTLLLERKSHHGTDRVARVGRVFVLPTLAVHALLDGIALAFAFSDAGLSGSAPVLGSALVIHRVPEGIFVARELGTEGLRGAMFGVSVLALATVFGAAFGAELAAHLPDAALHAVAALGLGAMLRLVTHRHGGEDASLGARAVAALGFLGGAAAVVTLPSPAGVLDRAVGDELSIAQSLRALFVATAPALLLGLLGLLGVELFAAMSPRARERPSVRESGAALVYARLVGWPFALVFLVARLAVGALLSPSAASVEPAAPSLGRAARRSIGLSLDYVAAPYVIGLVAAAVIEAALDPALAGRLGPVFALLGGSVLAVIGSSSVYATAPIAAVLIHKGLAPSAALVAVIAGCGLRELGRRAGGSRLARGAGVLAIALLSGLAVSLFVPRTARLALHEILTRRGGGAETIASVALGFAVLASFVRSGPRAWFAASVRGSCAHGDHDPAGS